ncbi:hypothetical protein F7U74_22760 [Vibrio vulnificus]|uniref:hypothetical protein n=1 Tax=Vibrio vulnificus TaxID=672 RepID=UPI001022AD3C|nr:hypothetical protein [Vibrio vulnificus]EGQ9284165.1 hypothetical protein [Vibrio vulnificus]ELV8693237.1 hypothetical protein [Vibrio vulnificus]MCU8120397.1 hypothetical protein [Vibrio vulnificus]MCU8184059.1 hypothetical protein [Vibrio vulnificus]MCU8457056.1 hypothetical protein [Vibrio vulnificus]
MKLMKIVGFLLVVVLTINLCVSTFSIFQLYRYLEIEDGSWRNSVRFYTEARHSKQISVEDRTTVTKLIAKELFILGHEHAYYVDRNGNETIFEPTEEHQNERQLRFQARLVSIAYIHEQLWLNAFYVTLLLVIATIKGKLQKRI